MATIGVLSQASALNQGAQLWVVPGSENSRWTMKIDWYLNFQISKASRHQAPPSPLYLQKVAAETGLEKTSFVTASQSPLLIPCHDLLPCRWTAMVPLHKNYTEWVLQIEKLWESLERPSFRVFLPAGQNAGGFNELWQNENKFEDFTVVLD